MVWESDLPSKSSEIGSGDESQSSEAEQSFSSFTEPEVSSSLVEAAGLTTQKVKGQLTSVKLQQITFFHRLLSSITHS